MAGTVDVFAQGIREMVIKQRRRGKKLDDVEDGLVSGGPFGVEDSVQAAGPLLALVGFLVPEALVTAECFLKMEGSDAFLGYGSCGRSLAGEVDNPGRGHCFRGHREEWSAGDGTPLVGIMFSALLSWLSFQENFLYCFGMIMEFLALNRSSKSSTRDIWGDHQVCASNFAHISESTGVEALSIMVAERALYMWNNERFGKMVLQAEAVEEVLSVVVEGMEKNVRGHWSKADTECEGDAGGDGACALRPVPIAARS
ncbi:hypothetical protein SASPL_115025 [Salvia splendens]|uniref:Uncharacterized protein n=1 Tax=Salvia splendens TaxID=180675 RepID=A0A8X8ZZX0_SALSN|nr:hypothetical protein SASPL_115025 [Salvia splendens]